MAEQSMRERADWETASMRARVAAVIQAYVINGYTFTQIADAVLAEIETPTEGMIDAARNPLVANGSPMSKGPHEVWLAMIRAAREGR